MRTIILREKLDNDEFDFLLEQSVEQQDFTLNIILPSNRTLNSIIADFLYFEVPIDLQYGESPLNMEVINPLIYNKLRDKFVGSWSISELSLFLHLCNSVACEIRIFNTKSVDLILEVKFIKNKSYKGSN